MAKEIFRSTSFNVNDFKPTPQLGNFDASYSPATKELKIDIRYSLAFADTFNDGGKWTELTKVEFKTKFTNSIPEFWNNKFIIKCTKPDWEEFTAKAVFSFTEGANPHFKVVAKGTTGASNTYVRPDGNASFGREAADRSANKEMQEKQIKEALSKPFDVEVGIPTHGGQFSFATMSMLSSFAKNTSYIFAGKKNPPEIIITAINSKSTDAAQKVKTILQGLGVKNLIKIEPGNQLNNPCTKVNVKFNRMQHDSWLNKSADDYKPLLSQKTVVHEYGHMLGLPDEYNCLCSQSANSLAALNLILNGVEKATHLKNTVINKDNVSSDSISQNQQLFHEMCFSAGIVPPPFGRPNFNIMSGGSNFEEHHCITAWKCLCELTKNFIDKEYWQIRLK